MAPPTITPPRPASGPAAPAAEPAAIRPAAPSRGFRPDIEGLRAVAVLLVVLFHAGVPFLPGGYVGVDVFFVISGYLITRLLVSELLGTGRISLSRFYLRRARRLLPALALVSMSTLVASRLLAQRLATVEGARDGMWSSVYLANFRFIHVQLDYLAADRLQSPFLHLWSLAVEEQFYLAWPLLLVAVAGLAGRRGSRTVRALAIVLGIGALASLGASVLLTHSRPVLAYYSPFTRAWELAIGGVVAVVTPALGRVPGALRGAATWCGLAAITASAMTYSLATPFPGYAALLPVLGAAAVIAGAQPGSRSERLLGLAPMQRIGLISYSLYLWHWPLLVIAEQANGHRPALAVNLGLVAVAIALAAATLRWVENPVRHARTLVTRPVLGLLVAVLLTVGPALAAWAVAVEPVRGAGAALAERGLEVRSASERQRRLDAALRSGIATRAVPRNLTPSIASITHETGEYLTQSCHLASSAPAAVPAGCNYGNLHAATRVVVFGDSHAGQWYFAMLDVARRHDARVEMRTRTLCPSLDMDVTMADGSPYPLCGAWRSNVLDQVAREQPTLVVLANAAAYCHAPQACADGLSRTLHRIHAASPDTRVAVVQDLPLRRGSVPNCLSAHLRDASACSERARSATRPALTAALIGAARDGGARFVHTERWYCVDGRCPAIVGHYMAYRDSNHMTGEYVRYISPMMDAALAPLLD